jgi:hypothetical protein
MWHEFKNYDKVEIWVLHSQFTNSHFHLHIILEMMALNGASVTQNQFLHSCCVQIHPRCAELKSAQSISIEIWPLFLPTRSKSHFIHLHRWTLPTSTYPINSIQLTLVPLVERYSYCKCYPLWKYKCLIHKSYRPVNFIFMCDIPLCVQ